MSGVTIQSRGFREALGSSPRNFAVFPWQSSRTVFHAGSWGSIFACWKKCYLEIDDIKKSSHRHICLQIEGAAHFFRSLRCRPRMHEIIIVAGSLDNQVTIQATFSPRKRVIDQVEMTRVS